MAGSRKWQGLVVVSAVDLSGTTPGTGPLYKAITHAGNIAGVGSGALGLLQFGAQSGAHVDVGWEGDMKYVAAAAIAAGGLLAVTTSGYLTVPVSGAGVVGRNADLAVASGEIGEGTFNFALPQQWRPDSYNLDDLSTFTTANNLSGATLPGLAVQASSGDFPAAGGSPTGILVVGATSGNTAIQKVSGVVQVRAGGVLGTGDLIRHAASGWWVAADSGDKCGARALAASAAGNSGGLVSAFFLAVPHYLTSCLDLIIKAV